MCWPSGHEEDHMATATHTEPLARHDLLAHHDPKWQDLERLLTEGLMYDAVIDEIDGRRIRVGALADRLRLLQLPRLRPGSARSSTRSTAGPPLGHPPQLVAAAGQPAAVPADRGAADRPARRPRHAGAADDHAHPPVGDARSWPASGTRPAGRAGAQDHLRRLRLRPRPGRHRAPLPTDDLDQLERPAAHGAGRGPAGRAWTASTA